MNERTVLDDLCASRETDSSEYGSYHEQQNDWTPFRIANQPLSSVQIVVLNFSLSLSSKHALHLCRLSSSHPSRQEDLHHQSHAQLPLPGSRREVSHSKPLIGRSQQRFVSATDHLVDLSRAVINTLLMSNIFCLQGSAIVRLPASGLGGNPHPALHPP